ncbi:MAG: DUF3575 domain-containing protein [Alistipes sp.]|nr:DUF3575 domain-containing protein [Alistipes sp.]
MKRLVTILFATAVALCSAPSVSAQTYVKLNALYALAGIINPQVEFCISNHSAVQVEATYSPWKSIKGNHAEFGIFMGEYRYYFRQAAKGWYVAGNVGFMGFDVSKPRLFRNGKILDFKNSYSKGFGLLLGAGAGYQHTFKERWVVDAFVAIDFFRSWYNGYYHDGRIEMNPHGHEDYTHPDPFNGSAECVPAKIGVSIGYRIFDPSKHRK